MGTEGQGNGGGGAAVRVLPAAEPRLQARL